MGILLSGDVRIVPALELIAESLGNSLYRDDLRAIAFGVGHGKQLSYEFRMREARFPAIAFQMVAVGEQTGDLQASLLAYRDVFYFVAIIFLCTLPLILLLGSPPKPAAQPAT